MSRQEAVICTYRVKAGCEAEFEKLLRLHWPTLHKAGLVTDVPATHFKKLPSAKPGSPHVPKGAEYREIMAWKDESSPGKAHHNPVVMAVWEPMGNLCEGRDGLPSMEFPHFEVLNLVGHPAKKGAKKSAKKPAHKPAKKAAKKPAKKAQKRRK